MPGLWQAKYIANGIAIATAAAGAGSALWRQDWFTALWALAALAAFIVIRRRSLEVEALAGELEGLREAYHRWMEFAEEFQAAALEAQAELEKKDQVAG